jgi:small subunit ribosomal protein S6
MPLYETMFICRQDMTPEAVNDLSKQLSSVIADGEGKVVKTDNWGLKTLAYKIQKNKKGYYVLLDIDAPAPTVLEMERQIRINEDVLRYMTIRVEEFAAEETTEEKEAA